MAVATKFFNWQQSGLTPGAAPHNGCSPNLTLIRNHIIDTWGGQFVGCYVNRPIVAGSAPSSHAFGAAVDVRYENPGPGRDRFLSEILPWLINNSAELHVQALHDYVGSRVWRANRSGDANGGWRPQPTGSQMGRAWALWVHIEVTRDGWADVTPIRQRLSAAPPAGFDPANGHYAHWPNKTNKPTIRNGSRGDSVKYLQGVLRNATQSNVAVDGRFGPQTESRVRDMQRFFGLTVDGWVGRQSWGVVDLLAGA